LKIAPLIKEALLLTVQKNNTIRNNPDPIDRIMELAKEKTTLYERMLEPEKEKNALLEKLLKDRE
jgi:hypothetical protein